MSSSQPENKADSPAANLPAAVQDNLHQLDRLANIGFVSASVAHEIKNALVAVTTFTEVLLEKGEHKEMATVVRRELKRIDGLVTQMLRYSVSKPTLRTSVRVQEIMDYSLRLLEPQMSGQQITLKCEYRAASDTVLGDESQLQQAFLNLFLNAVEAMSQAGELTVTTKSDGGKVKITIHDTGAGIAPEIRALVFKPFFTTKKNGTGLGLAICRRVVEDHHGMIELKSESGQGTTFTITLPAA